MSLSYPTDEDGEALRLVAEHGSDMSKPMKIDFAVAVPDEEAGQKIAELVEPLGYEPDVDFDEESEEFTCYCAKIMIPDYDAMLAAQDQLDEIARPYGGYIDGWGTFGNKELRESRT